MHRGAVQPLNEDERENRLQSRYLKNLVESGMQCCPKIVISTHNL